MTSRGGPALFAIGGRVEFFDYRDLIMVVIMALKNVHLVMLSLSLSSSPAIT